MSRYIRTENRIYELNNDVYVENNEAFMKWFNGIGKEIEPTCLGKVIKQSDAIEELCDVVVIKRTNKDTNITWYADYPMEQFKDIKRTSYLPYIQVDYIKFGIWNDDKGLIYVAKMNEKGELVLI